MLVEALQHICRRSSSPSMRSAAATSADVFSLLPAATSPTSLALACPKHSSLSLFNAAPPVERPTISLNARPDQRKRECGGLTPCSSTVALSCQSSSGDNESKCHTDVSSGKLGLQTRGVTAKKAGFSFLGHSNTTTPLSVPSVRRLFRSLASIAGGVTCTSRSSLRDCVCQSDDVNGTKCNERRFASQAGHASPLRAAANHDVTGDLSCNKFEACIHTKDPNPSNVAYMNLSGDGLLSGASDKFDGDIAREHCSCTSCASGAPYQNWKQQVPRPIVGEARVGRRRSNSLASFVVSDCSCTVDADHAAESTQEVITDFTKQESPGNSRRVSEGYKETPLSSSATMAHRDGRALDQLSASRALRLPIPSRVIMQDEQMRRPGDATRGQPVEVVRSPDAIRSISEEGTEVATFKASVAQSTQGAFYLEDSTEEHGMSPKWSVLIEAPFRFIDFVVTTIASKIPPIFQSFECAGDQLSPYSWGPADLPSTFVSWPGINGRTETTTENAFCRSQSAMSLPAATALAAAPAPIGPKKSIHFADIPSSASTSAAGDILDTLPTRKALQLRRNTRSSTVGSKKRVSFNETLEVFKYTVDMPRLTIRRRI